MVNILIVSTTSYVGGAEIVLKSWIENSVNNYYILTSNDIKVKGFYNSIESNNIKGIFSIKEACIIKKKLFNIPKFIINNTIIVKNIKQIVNKHNIQLVYGNNSLDCLPTLMYKSIFNKNMKIINHVHDILLKSSSAGIFLKLFWKKSNIIFVPSKATKNQIVKLGVDEKKIEVIYNSVDNSQEPIVNRDRLREKYGIKQDNKIFLFVGSFSERKNIELFLNIIERAYVKEKMVKAIIVGRIENKSYYELIKNTIKLMKCPVDILTDITHNEMNNFYFISDILILTSNEDPLPTVILEAMTEGVLVYSRNVGGVSEMIEDNNNGYLFAYNEDLDDICKKLIDILHNETGNKGIIYNAKCTINKKFSHNVKVRKIENIIKTL